jgi:hypothetical protein
VLTPDVYDPALNPLYRDVLAHYGVVALPCRVGDPDRKGKVESAIGHTQRTPLKGLRFEILDEAQAYLDRWDARWADTRIHGTTKRQVAAMFAEEQRHLPPLPLEPFRPPHHREPPKQVPNSAMMDALYFVRAHALLEDLRAAHAEHRLERRLRVYLAPKLLIIDDFGVWACDRLAATAFFTLISARYERGSVVLTSNKGFGEWGEVLGDPVIATAILDRLLHHSHVMNIRGESYRLREKKRAGLLGVGTVPPVVTLDEDVATTNPPGVGQLQTGAGGSKVRRR